MGEDKPQGFTRDEAKWYANRWYRHGVKCLGSKPLAAPLFFAAATLALAAYAANVVADATGAREG